MTRLAKKKKFFFCRVTLYSDPSISCFISPLLRSAEVGACNNHSHISPPLPPRLGSEDLGGLGARPCLLWLDRRRILAPLIISYILYLFCLPLSVFPPLFSYTYIIFLYNIRTHMTEQPPSIFLFSLFSFLFSFLLPYLCEVSNHHVICWSVLGDISRDE